MEKVNFSPESNKMEGQEKSPSFLEKIRQNMSLKATPILILSNLGQEEDIEKAKKLGATDYLVKAHFSFAEIIKKIHEIVG